VTVREPIRSYVSRLAAHTRENVELGVSPRGAIALVRAAQARAVLNGRDYVVPDDVQAEARTVWAHRIRAEGTDTGMSVVERAIDNIDVE
jgi:MoxR-like ATPase